MYFPPYCGTETDLYHVTQAITVDSRAAAGAPPRVEGNNPAPDYEDETEL
jgi:hypothetical protein